MFNIILVEDKYDKNAKWAVWGKNVGKQIFSHIVPFNSFLSIENLSIDESGKDEKYWRCPSKIRNTDIIRKFTPNEYIFLGKMLKKNGYVYNKKKNTFIKTI